MKINETPVLPASRLPTDADMTSTNYSSVCVQLTVCSICLVLNFIVYVPAKM